MELSELIKPTRKSVPPRIIMYGPHKIGKSTFGANAPNPIFVPTEDGLSQIDTAAFPKSNNLDEFMNYLDMLFSESHEYQTVVIDTLDWLENLIFDRVIEEYNSENNKNIGSIEDIGYAKGYIFALKHWQRVIDMLDCIHSKGMAIILLAHAEIKSFNPPDSDAYERWQIKVHHKGATKLEEWSDAILFANYKTFIRKDDKKKNKAVGGERVIYTSPNPAYRAGNRYSLPDELPMDFNELLKYIKGV